MSNNSCKGMGIKFNDKGDDLIELDRLVNADFRSATAGLKGVRLIEAHLDWPSVDFGYIPVSASASPDAR
jgi:hypothetical protein